MFGEMRTAGIPLLITLGIRYFVLTKITIVTLLVKLLLAHVVGVEFLLTYCCQRDNGNGEYSGQYLVTQLEVPKYESPYWFKIGDTVELDPDKAEWPTWRWKRNPTDDPLAWIEGQVTAVDVIKPHPRHHIVYECSVVDDGKARKCHVCYNNDEHIAAFQRSARDRLIDSIKQGCDFEHISRLIEQSRLDISMIKSLVLSFAIRHGSYDMLLWTDKNLPLPLTSIEDKDGNLLQHQIAALPEAARFMQKLRDNTKREIELSVLEGDNKPWQENKRGKTWTDILVRNNNQRALELLVRANEDSDFFQTAAQFLMYMSGYSAMQTQSLPLSYGNAIPLRQILDDCFKARKCQYQKLALARCANELIESLMQERHMTEFVKSMDITQVLRVVHYGLQTDDYFINQIVRRVVSSVLQLEGI
jgi:hypothetical protein